MYRLPDSTFKRFGKAGEPLSILINQCRFQLVVKCSRNSRIDGIAVERVIRFRSNHSQTIVDNGDSGSVLLAPIFFEGQKALLVVGLVFAGDSAARRIGYACHFGDVVAQLELNVAGAVALDDDRWEFNREPL